MRLQEASQAVRDSAERVKQYRANLFATSDEIKGLESRYNEAEQAFTSYVTELPKMMAVEKAIAEGQEKLKELSKNPAGRTADVQAEMAEIRKNLIAFNRTKSQMLKGKVDSGSCTCDSCRPGEASFAEPVPDPEVAKLKKKADEALLALRKAVSSDEGMAGLIKEHNRLMNDYQRLQIEVMSSDLPEKSVKEGPENSSETP